MPRMTHLARFLIRPICMTLVLSAGGARAIAQPSAAAIPPNARTALEAIQPVPEFPEQSSDVALLRPDDLPGTDRRQLRDAEARFAEGRWADAVEKLDPLIAAHPTLAEGRVLRARCHARLGDFAKASADIAGAISVDPRHVAAHELAGETALLAGDKQTAIREFRLALLADTSAPPSSDAALATLFLARTLESEGYWSAAVTLYSTFLESTSDMTPDMRRNDRLREMVETTGPELRRRIASIQARLGESSEAVDAWERVVEEKADDANAWRELAFAQVKRGDVDAAFESLRRYLGLARVGAGGAVELDALCRLLPSEASCEARADGLVKSLDDFDLTIFWVRRLLKAKDLPRAKALLGPSIAAHPDRAEFHYLLAECHAAAGDMTAAYGELVRGGALDSEPTGRLLSMLGDDEPLVNLDELLHAGKAHLESHSEDTTSRLVYSTLLSLAHQPEAAVEQLLRVTREAPDNGTAWTGLAEAYVQQREWIAALEAATKAIDSGARTQRVYFLKGVAHDALNEDAAAIEAFEQAGQIDPTRSDAFMGIAGVAERNGDRLGAERVYRQVLASVDPECVAARERLIVYYINTARFREAQALFEQMERRHPDSPALVRCSAMIDLLAARDQTPESRLDQYLAKLRSILKDHPRDADTYVELAKTFIAVSRFDEALAELTSAVRVDPENIRALELKAEAHGRLLDFPAAESVIDRLLKFRPRDLRYIQSKLDYTNNRGAADAAIELLRSLIDRADLSEHRDRFTLQLLQELRMADRSDEAVVVAKAWLDERPSDVIRRGIYLEVLGAAGRNDDAAALARTYLADQPTSLEARVQLLDYLKAAGRVTEAMQLALEWLESNPSDAVLTEQLVRLCWTARQWDDAIDIAKSAIESTDQPRRYEQLLSETFQHARRFDDAIDMRREHVRRYQKLLDSARRTPHEARLMLDLRQANYQLINAMMSAGRYADAERAIESLLAPMLANPVDMDAAYVMDLRNILSEVYRQSGDDTKAIEQLEEIYSLVPQDAGANNNLGYTLADTGRQIQRAEQLVRFSLAQDPNSSASLDTLGWVLYKQGRFEEAVYYLRLALRASAYSDPVILDHLADAHYRMGKKTLAERGWRKAMRLCDPESDPPPGRDRIKLHGVVESKLDALSGGEAVSTAPLAEDSRPTTMPADAA